ncbi:hypothetical protein [Methylobacterium oxalidis]|uniref:hypothetical protein n=1 Tax=Methylobacterium oxalidis TaxID=944322 RepID=UPI0033151E98
MAEIQAQKTSAQGSSGAKQSGSGQGQQRSESFADQAQSAMRGVADQASDMWDSASDQGQRYYRQGSQALGNMDGATLGGLFAAGALGFAIAWLIFGQSSASRDVSRRMSRSSERYR